MKETLTCTLFLLLGLAMAMFANIRINHGTAQFGIIVDAGSSGSRIHIYKHTNGAQLTEVAVLKQTPGLSDTVTWSDEQINVYLDKLLKVAENAIGKAERASTGFWVRGTAGLRLLSEADSSFVIERVVRRLRASDFDFQDFRILDGADEARFMWQTVTELSKRAGVRAANVGSMDFGGGSTQIAFQSDTETGDLELRSFLKYGVNEARYRYYHALLEREQLNAGDIAQLADPCLAQGTQMSLERALLTRATSNGGLKQVEGELGYNDITLVGSGSFEQCYEETQRLLESIELHGKWRPETLFFARDHVVRIYKALGTKQQPVLSDLKAAAKKICGDGDAPHNFYCFEGTYVFSVLHNAYEFPLDSSQVRFTNEIGGISPTWAFGAISEFLKKTKN